MKLKLTNNSVLSLELRDKPYEVYDTEETGFCLVVRPSGTKSFCLKYRNNEGKKRTCTIGTHGRVTVKQARDEARRLNGRIVSGEDVHVMKRQRRLDAEKQRQQTLSVFFEEKYEPYLLAEMKTGKDRAYLIRHYFVEPFGARKLVDINAWLITNWRKQQLERGLKHAGVNRPISALKALMNRAVEWEVIESNPLESVKALKEDPNPVVRYLSETEERQLREALDTRQEQQMEERRRYNQWLTQRGKPVHENFSTRTFTDYLKPLVLLALNTGLRRGELFDLCVDDVQNGQIVVRGNKSKSGKTRHVPLTEEGRQILDAWIRETKPIGLVFPSPQTGERLDNINTAWKGLMKRASIDDFRFHDCRHTYASKLVGKGADLYVVKELLGHSSIETTQRYAHLAPSKKAEAVRLLN
ncbi:MAG: site-specific integrase [Pseudomonadales bacterium]|nr:site-specific integrase [Pseudomonadales bacterium]